MPTKHARASSPTTTLTPARLKALCVEAGFTTAAEAIKALHVPRSSWDNWMGGVNRIPAWLPAALHNHKKLRAQAKTIQAQAEALQKLRQRLQEAQKKNFQKYLRIRNKKLALYT